MVSKKKGKEQDNNWEERVVQVRRVTKVVKGGKKLSFRAILVVGNEKGQIGVGIGKASDVIGAVKKGVTDAKKHLVSVPLTKSNSIPHPINGTSGAAQVIMRPSAPGSGVIAGGSVRTVLELSGVKNILAKQLGSSNALNNARATLNALSNLRTFNQTAKDRNISIDYLYGR
uniref:Small ribosomal subunit protein uS5c n=1 Tax=Ahnfeltia plicata TaxID=28023 RepID=A0A1C9CBF2_9FLOR|nr:ribosomal protein S5 [Ahnfeltia plicata]YP_010204098.1 ribosomal protein S5 [Ahnfeltia fastigiata]AOM65674.1 ribosomal protein S5 [Ahnfeltia plicata]UAT97413.1 ribosomal protein S5 [Ahnfeltia plicata]UAT97617.1 ribosomal protein S5 [Ahnfeltia fastigiata]UAT97821.1 ribosomal protein S5 [Ahnfeltia fastigiata]